MSRIGKKPIEIPENVEVKIDNNVVVVKGPKGELTKSFRPEVNIEMKDSKVFISLKNITKENKAFQGLTRALLFNMVEGVSKGFEKRLEIIGVGFKALVEEGGLSLNVGFSHSVKIKIDKNINFLVEKNIIILSGFDKELITQTAANIRKIKKPEPYKGKGIRYQGEVVRKKMGKKAAGTGGK